MASAHSLRNLAFRVHLQPAPRTQSESNAILRALQDLGPVSTFQVDRRPLRFNTGRLAPGTCETAVANLIFANNTKKVDSLRNEKAAQKFSVTANADHRDASVKDPYNVRGLQSRKPELQPREIHCHIIPVEHQRDRSQEEAQSLLAAISNNEYRDTFAVDRNSIFAEILAKTDCPSGLIHGLLPKLKEEHRTQAYELGAVKSKEDQTRKSIQSLMLKGYHGQKAGRDVELVQLDIDRLREWEEGSAAAAQDEKHASSEGESSLNAHDEFAALRNVSLMQMYREATREEDTVVNKEHGDFRPFTDKS